MDRTITAIGVKRFTKTAKLPTRAYFADAGLDLYADSFGTLFQGKPTEFNLNIGVDIPVGYVGIIASRSSMARKGIDNLGGIIDAGYTGSISVMLVNNSGTHAHVEPGDKIAQLLIVPVALPEVRETDTLTSVSGRGKNGYGSTGK